MRLLVTVTGPSASGKTELLKTLTSNPTFAKLVSVTTRPKRDGEVEGEDYYFISEDDYQELVDNNQIVQSVNFKGCNYATTKAEIDKVFSTNKVPVVIVEPGGVTQFRSIEHELDYTVYSVYIDAPLEILKGRYVKRSGGVVTPYDEERLKAIEDEFETWPTLVKYDAAAVNQGSNKSDLEWIASTLVSYIGEFINNCDSRKSE